MKNKLINFIAAMGIPVSGITTQGGRMYRDLRQLQLELRAGNCCFTAFGRQGNLQTLS